MLSSYASFLIEKMPIFKSCFVLVKIFHKSKNTFSKNDDPLPKFFSLTPTLPRTFLGCGFHKRLFTVYEEGMSRLDFSCRSDVFVRHHKDRTHLGNGNSLAQMNLATAFDGN